MTDTAIAAPTTRPVPRRWLPLAEAGYLLLVFASLVSFGAVYPLPLASCILLAALLSMAGLAESGRPVRTRAIFNAAVALLLALTLWIGLQTLPMPVADLAAPIWRELPAFGIADGRNSISVAPAETVAGWLRLVLPFLAFLAGLLIFRTDERARAAFALFALGGGLLATLCLAEFLLLPGSLLLSERQYDQGGFTLTFVNRNTAATCLGLIVLMLLVRTGEEWAKLDRNRLLAWIMNGTPLGRSVRPWPLLLQPALLAVVLAALALTRSRAGIASTAAGAAVLVVLLAWSGGGPAPAGFTRRRRGRAGKALRTILALAAVLLAVAFLAPQTIFRAEVQGGDDGRFCILDGLFAAARDNLLTGGGFGAFAFVFSPYRDPVCGTANVWDKAHNLYLEGLIGLGIPFVPLLLAALWALAWAYGTGLRQRRSLRAYPAAGLAGLVLVLSHSALDFPLQVPGMAVFYAMFAALTVTLSLGRRQLPEAPGPIRRVPASGAALVAIALLGTVLAAFDARDAAAGAAVRRFARALDAGRQVDDAALAALIAGHMPADRLTGCKAAVLRPSLTVLLAALDRTDRDRAYEDWAARLAAAEEQVRHGLSCMPADGNLWLRLAMLRQAGGEVAAEQARLMALSQQLNPSEGRLLTGRLAHWNRLSAATVALAREEAAADLRNGLVYLPPPELQAVLATQSQAMADLLRETLPLIPEERRKALGPLGG
ncbi:O-antigen ligase family protein [Shinella pollutisoli]|uniref:O-antigen ligase family protein n=1 Tax=Shinella pollutisoli TaxID=2250594 RepID=A0ABV7DE75_9HYPH|nr:O-antigen ligase family protein [Shinella pollutisoli]